MFGLGGPSPLLSRETSKPVSVGATLARLMRYFRPYWAVLVLVAALVIVSSWTQVITPDLTGQVVDCYLTPAAAGMFGAAPSLPGAASAAPATNCWYTTVPADRSMADTITGLGGLVLLLVLVYVAGAVLTGLQFFLNELGRPACAA